MIVYGDPQFESTLADLVRRLSLSLTFGETVERDRLRAALIQAGQLEQAVADHGGSLLQRVLPLCEQLTDRLAEVLTDSHSNPQSHAIRAAWNALDKLVQADRAFGDILVTVKVPEGFEFYALYPEQYLGAADQWLAIHPPSENQAVLVVGIRGIGTTLSAVVLARVRLAGWRATRVTVRPYGHPFGRKVDLKPLPAMPIRRALVVDEGPGISGSSMAATAQALTEIGIGAEAISFLPGHAGEPGSAATSAVRQWWSQTARHVLPFEKQLGGKSLPERLSEATALALQEPILRVQDISAGLWRAEAYSQTKHWPAVAKTFERSKYIVVGRSGNALIWKFAGLDAWVDGNASGWVDFCSSVNRLAEKGWCPPLVAARDGFVAMPWVLGDRLQKEEASAPLLASIAEYLVAAAGPPLGPIAAEEAFNRLRAMTVCNTREALGEGLSDAVAKLFEKTHPDPQFPSYGDGRMGPHEWIRTASGTIVKTDNSGHIRDHTVIGRQSLLWDIAGVLVEWQLSPGTRRGFLSAFRFAEGSLGDLRLFEIAYCAFQLGRLSMGSYLAGADPVEAPRLEAALHACKARLRERIAEAHPVASQKRGAR